jgi:hypothetical protein
MTAQEILAAWKAAAASGNFYAEFEKATGFPEADVKKHFAAWGKLRHETAEEIATENDVTIREGGFQAYLADIKHIGHPRICGIVDEGYYEDEDPNPRQGRPWSSSEDCKGCDGRDGAQYQHKFGCVYHGGRAGELRIPVTKGPDGKFRVT